MSDRNWLLIIAIGGSLAVAISLLLYFEPPAPSVRETHSESDQWERSYDGEVTCNADCQVTFGVGGDRSDKKTNDSQNNANGPDDNALSSTDADLLAQERMAFWTRWIGAFTIIGVALLIWTLIETRRATKAAFSANQIARNLAEAETRPRIVIGHDNVPRHYVDPSGIRGVQITVPFPNIGKEPALQFRQWVVAGDVNDPSFVPKPSNSGPPNRPDGVVFTGIGNLGVKIQLSFSQIKKISDEERPYHLAVYSEYKRISEQEIPYVTAATLAVRVVGFKDPGTENKPIFDIGTVEGTITIT